MTHTFTSASTPAQCQRVPFEVTGGTPPYKLTVLPKSVRPITTVFLPSNLEDVAQVVQKTIWYSTGNFVSGH